MKCPYCGNETRSETCPGCGRDLRPFYAIRKASAKYYNLGLASAEDNRLETARAYLKKALSYDLQNFEARNLLGLIDAQVGEPWLAEEELKRSVEIEPDQTKNPGVSLLNRLQHGYEGEQLRSAVRHYNQALAQFRDGQTDSAQMHLKRAVSESPRMVKARQLLACVYLDQGDTDKAQTMLDAAIRANAQDPANAHLVEKLEEAKRERKDRDNPQEDAVELEIPGLDRPVATTVDAEGRRIRRKYTLTSILRQNPLFAQVALFLIGLGAGLAFMAFLMLPQQTKEIRRERDDLQIRLTRMENEQRNEDSLRDNLQEELASLTAQYEEMKRTSGDFENNAGALMRAVAQYQAGNGTLMKEELTAVQPDSLTVEQRVVYVWLDSLDESLETENGEIFEEEEP
ncbi:MAG: tetratricopeptide repeat protein [Firmicutes bacterium]|nr:tetratricopeptide repeat protein [Bacillota bacterium]